MIRYKKGGIAVIAYVTAGFNPVMIRNKRKLKKELYWNNDQ